MSPLLKYLSMSIVSLLLIFGAIRPGFPCSTFVLRHGDVLLFGRNWDHYTSKGLIVVNRRGIAKTAMIFPPAKPARWVSKYGSITFNQIGKEFPYGGMNEEGLVVEMMGHDEAEYPESSELPLINEVQWIQYQLDNCRTINEVIETVKTIKIGQNWSPLHYLVCDRYGNAAAIEFIEGEFVCHSGKDLPIPVLTNTSYDGCIQDLNAYEDLAGEEKIAHSTLSSNDRFIKIARRLGDVRSEGIEPAVEYAFDILTSVGIGRFLGQCTAWSIVYDLMELKIYFKTFENRNVRIVEMNALDFSNDHPPKAFDITNRLKRDVSSNFITCTAEMNRELIYAVLKIYKESGFLRNLPESAGYFLAIYPERYTAPDETQ